MGVISQIIGTITFNGGTLKDLMNRDKGTAVAWLLIFLASAISAVIGAEIFQMTGDPEFLGFASLFVGDITAFAQILVLVFVFQFLFILFLAGVLAFVGRGFGGKTKMMGLVRLIGFASVLVILEFLLYYLSALQNNTSLIFFGSIVSLWRLVVIIYGFSKGSDLNIIVGIIAFIIGLIVASILLGIVLIVLVASIIVLIT